MYWLMNANSSNVPEPAGDISQLELYFGGLAFFAVVAMLLWLWLRTRDPIHADEPPETDT